MESGEPLIYANVFLDGSFIGTVTDSTGYFELNTRGHSSLPLIVSSIGYETLKISDNYISDNLIIRLQKLEYELDEVTISPNTKNRKKYLRQFRREFLGTTKNASDCEILNEEVLFPFYNEETKVLHVNAIKPIEIINHALGFKIVYLLRSFKKTREGVNYKGFSLFLEQEAKNSVQQRKIQEQRKLAFNYSRINFIRELYSGSLLYSDYKLYDNLGNYMEANDILYTTDDNTKEICMEKSARIYYDQAGTFSYFVLNQECVEIEKNGYYNPDLITWFGDLATHRVGDLMPYNYKPQVE